MTFNMRFYTKIGSVLSDTKMPHCKLVDVSLRLKESCQTVFEDIASNDVNIQRVITVIEVVRLVILGSTALFTKVGQLHILYII